MKKPFASLIVILASVFTIGIGTLSPEPAFATGLPVIDAANLTQNTITATNAPLITANTASIAYSTGLLSAAYQARKGPVGSGVGLDSIAWMVAKLAIQMMVKSTVNWINSGFQGSPAFVTNPTAFFLQVSDVAANTFLQQLASNGSLHSPFQSSVAQSVSNNYYLSTSGSGGFFTAAAYTLNQIVSNDSAFLGGNFSQGGWSGWYSAASNPQNNPYGARMLAAGALAQQVANAQGTQAQKLNWGQGFLSWCGNATGGGGGANSGSACTSDSQCAGALACISGKCAVDASLDSNSATTCTNKDGSTGTIQTPGSVIQAQINKQLGISGDTLVTADEFNEVISALLSQLLNQVLGGTGLGGIGSVSSGGNGYIDQATNPSALTNAVNASQTEGTFVNGVNDSITQLQQYQSDVQDIENEALLASAALGSNPPKSCNASAKLVQKTLVTSTKALNRTNDATNSLQMISQDATNAIVTGTVVTGTAGTPTGATATIENVSNQFQTFVASPAMPSPTEITYVHQQSQSTAVFQNASGSVNVNGSNDQSPSQPTLFDELQAIANGNCIVDTNKQKQTPEATTTPTTATSTPIAAAPAPSTSSGGAGQFSSGPDAVSP